MKIINILLIIAVLVFVAACTANPQQNPIIPVINNTVPDNTTVMVPVNNAPVNLSTYADTGMIDLGIQEFSLIK